jgi:iron complex transport system substrate-binding protein
MRLLPLACLALLACKPMAAPVVQAPVPPKAMPAASVVPVAFPKVLHDQLGRTVTVARNPARIVSLSPALTEILYAVGCGDRLVLRDGWSDFPPSARAVVAIEGFSPNAESILSAQPSLVLTHFPPPTLRTALEGAHVPWLGFAPETLPAVADSIRTVAQACGQDQRGDRVAAAFEQRLAAITRRLHGQPEPKVFYEMDAGIGGRPYTISKKSFGHAVLTAAGGRNVFAEADAPWFQVSTEAILAADPDFIALADADAADHPQSAEALARRPGMTALRAVREGHVIPLRSDWISRPGPRLVLGVEQLARGLHAQALRDLPVLPADSPLGSP